MKSLLHVGLIGHSFESLSAKGSGVCFLSDREAYAVWGSFLSWTEKRCKEEIVFFSRFYILSQGIIWRLGVVCCIHGVVYVVLFSGLSTL